MSRHFQFRIVGIFWVMFWLAVLITQWKAIDALDDNPVPVAEHLRQMLFISGATFLTAAYGVPINRAELFAAIGVLIGFFVASMLSPTVY